MNTVRKSIATLWPAIRISFVLALITTSVILTANFLGIAPNQTQYELENRKRLSESLAIIFSTMAIDSDAKNIRRVLSIIVLREDDILSAGFRIQSGKLLFQVGPHTQLWGDYKDNKSTTTHVLVPIYRGKTQIGYIELMFKQLFSMESFWSFNDPIYKFILFVLVFGFLSYLFFILRTLRQIDPSAVIPDRVNAAFDTLSEGVVIVDDKEQIILANKAFSETVKRTPAALLGHKLSDLNWKPTSEDAGEILYPWIIAMANGESEVGEAICIEVEPNDSRTLVVNCAPILDSQGKPQGMLLTFDDVTELQVQKQQLQVMVSDLETSKKEIQRQNKELHYLATRDPLTGSLNRRSFNELFAEQFNQARTQGEHLCCIMVDIDHFKKVNDNYGHGVGDEVIKLLADILQSSTRNIDIVSRYGGEEFCVILPGLDVDEAISVAERIRLNIKNDSASTFESGPRITASLGVASIHDHAKDPTELNEQADQALYVAKESGRNRVARWKAEAKFDISHKVEDNAETESKSDNRISISEHSSHVEEINSLQMQINQLEYATASFSEQLKQEQNYDHLTGLPNQALFYDRIKQAVERGDRQGRLTAILMVDFDLFAQANNSFGRVIADEMFVTLTKRLDGIFRSTDSITIFDSDTKDLTISRFDGDEIGILLVDLDDRMVVTWAAKRILDALNQPVIHGDKQVNVSCNIGISIFPEDAGSPEELIGHAGTARSFASKEHTSNGFHFFDPEMQKLSLKQIGLEAEIRRAIENEEWLLYYQPKMDIITKEIRSVEGLIRWNHPTRGILGPFEFIDLAEERGLIIDIGNWVTRTACRQAKIWSDAGLNIKVAINISAIQLRQKNFSDLILDIVKETHINPRQLELEVTETILMDNVETVVKHLNRLHCRGISISLDDFGTGYSSLGYLKQLPIDTLKIDRVFIKDIMTDDYDKNIVNTVISMAHGMDLKVVAEGVETQDQFNLLHDMSCDEIQGFLLSKPVDVDSVTQLFEQKKQFIPA